jgi:exodeoxyribonuclease VII large subunit
MIACPGVGQTPFTFQADKKKDEPFIFSVSGIVGRLRKEIEARHAVVWVGGEISSFQIHPASGHAYFSMKDQHAKLACVMWRDNLAKLRFDLKQGDEVIVRGRMTVYERGGQMQLEVLEVEPQGLGALQREFTERLEKLRAEGLTARKRPIPPFARIVGVVTSPGGAALRDVLRTILRRDPRAHVIISPAQVQGRSSAASIAAALDRIDALGRAELIIVARGGGSLEDLWAFNEESVARAIARCSVPVISGVGHETDTTIADHVADLRASTPTAAAEHAVPLRADIEARWRELSKRLTKMLRTRIDHHGRRLLSLEKRLADPTATIRRRAQYLDDLINRTERAMRRKLAESDRRLAIACGQLESMSPLAVLARGYAIAHREDGSAARRPLSSRSASACRFGSPKGARPCEWRTRMAETFEQLLERLEGIVDRLENEDLSLEDAIEAYREGVSIAKDGHTRLAQAERVIEEVTGKNTKPVEVEQILAE